jgi:hypothetical protein
VNDDRRELTTEEHRERHVLLHRMLDELGADYLFQNAGSLPSTTTMMDLMRWSHAQTLEPTSPKT